MRDRWPELQHAVRPTASAPAAVRAVEAGACPYAVAYATDVDPQSLSVLHVFEQTIPKYDLLLVQEREPASQLFEWLLSTTGREDFARAGFLAP